MPEIAHCRSCNAPIYWLKHHETGKLAPICAEPSENGNLIVDLDAGTYAVSPKNLYVQDDRRRHLNHFADCPNASTHHKRRA